MCHSIARSFTMSPYHQSHTHTHTHTHAPIYTQPSSSLLPNVQLAPIKCSPLTHTLTHTRSAHSVRLFLQMPNVAFGHISKTDRWTDRHAGRTWHSLLWAACWLLVLQNMNSYLLFFNTDLKVEQLCYNTKCYFSWKTQLKLQLVSMLRWEKSCFFVNCISIVMVVVEVTGLWGKVT